MYDRNSIQIPQPLPEQNPVPKARSVDRYYQTGHAGRDRMRERGYTPEQVYQTLAYGQERVNTGPSAQPGTSLFTLNSIDTPGTRRRVVADSREGRIATVLPREEIPQETVKEKAAPKSTKSKKKEQLAKKRARSAGNG